MENKPHQAHQELDSSLMIYYFKGINRLKIIKSFELSKIIALF
jgi:hypothetical protein